MRNSEALAGILRRFPGRRILVAGDVILDRYWWGDASRLSPEAPVPVVLKQRTTTRPGGAANTAANLAALGAAVELFGVTGADAERAELMAVLGECGVGAAGLVADGSRPTTSKTRVIATHQQIVRVDVEDTGPVEAAIAGAAVEALVARLPGADAVVVSDYAKGFASATLLAEVIEAARKAEKPVFVDPKGPGFGRYLGAFLLKPNRLELSVLTGLPARNHEETLKAGARLSAAMPGTDIVVTEGADGLTRFVDGEARESVRPAPRQVFDVTGAGDTVLAVLALARSAGAPHRDAMELAAEAAAIAIGLMGTAAVTFAQLEAAVADQGRPAAV